MPHLQMNPLALPKGSVRALIALLLLVPVAYSVIVVPEKLILIPEWIQVLLGVVVTFYFTMRNGK